MFHNLMLLAKAKYKQIEPYTGNTYCISDQPAQVLEGPGVNIFLQGNKDFKVTIFSRIVSTWTGESPLIRNL